MVTYEKGGRGSEGTRERLIGLLRKEPRSVEQLARALGITSNAVRSQLALLERDGMVQMVGERRGLRRPSRMYGLTSDAERLQSRAYAPVLKAVLETLAEKSTEEELEELLREAGRRIAAEIGRPAGNFHARAARVLQILKDLGGSAEVEEKEGKLVIRGHGCPLAAAVEVEPRICKCMEALLAELIGASVEEQCRRGDGSAHCAFVISPTEQESSTEKD